MDGANGTTGRRMRSGAVALGLVSTLALALTSCGSEPDRRCVDSTSNYQSVADKLCNSEADGRRRRQRLVRCCGMSAGARRPIR